MALTTTATPRRILYILPYVPSPIRVRPYQIIRHLSRMGHRVTVAALDDGSAGPETLRELQTVCEAVHIVPHPKAAAVASCLAALPTPTPLWAAYCKSPNLMHLLRDLTQSHRYDVAHVEHLRAAHFVRALPRELPTVFDAVDCITALRRQMAVQTGGRAANRLLSWAEWAKLRRYEPRAYRVYGRIAVTSWHDADALQALASNLPPIDVVPNGVDLDYFHANTGTDTGKETNFFSDTLVFSGKMNYHANDDAARFLLDDVLPRLRQIRPGVRVVVAGSRPTQALQAAAARARSNGEVIVTGYVDDLRPHLWGAWAAVCPMRVGVGIQNKVLEALAVGRPVVCTPLAARAFTPASQNGSDAGGPLANALWVAHGPEALAQACAEVLALTPDGWERAGHAARQYVEDHHDWRQAADTFTQMYDAVCTSWQSGGRQVSR